MRTTKKRAHDSGEHPSVRGLHDAIAAGEARRAQRAAQRQRTIERIERATEPPRESWPALVPEPAS